MPMYQGGGDNTITGEVRLWAGNIASIPTGWLFCNGASLLRASYPKLFAAIGVIYGNVDGTHFNAPDFRNKFLFGSEQDVAGIPKANYNGLLLQGGGNIATDTGYASVTDSGHTHTYTGSDGVSSGTDFSVWADYQASDTGYANLTDSGHTHVSIPPSFTITYIIKT